MSQIQPKIICDSAFTEAIGNIGNSRNYLVTSRKRLKGTKPFSFPFRLTTPIANIEKSIMNKFD